MATIAKWWSNNDDVVSPKLFTEDALVDDENEDACLQQEESIGICHEFVPLMEEYRSRMTWYHQSTELGKLSRPYGAIQITRYLLCGS